LATGDPGAGAATRLARAPPGRARAGGPRSRPQP
jgi:hypothetical protein